MIILFFGQPASGKTTLADRIYSMPSIFYEADNFIRIDGDKWRDVTKNKDYSKQGRINNLKGAFDMALYLEMEGYTPILSFVTPYEELREYLAQNANKLCLIYLQYNQNRNRSDYFAIDFEEPKFECLKLNTSDKDIQDCVSEAMNYISLCYEKY
jgi:adenylylsulfate kinase-like enzyme